MKTAKSLSFFKNGTAILSAVFVLGLMASCNKDASPATTTAASTTVTEADAAEVVTDAVTPQSEGMVAQVSDAQVMTASNAYACGEAFDSTITRASASGATISYSLSLAWGWKLSCANPANFTASFKGSSSYVAPKMSSSDSSSGSFTITGIEPASSDWVFNSSYTRNGSEQSNIGNKNTFTSTLTITSTNIQVSKTTQQIISGSGAVTISGASTSGKSFSFSGTITFNGSQTATLVITGGGTYQIAW